MACFGLESVIIALTLKTLAPPTLVNAIPDLCIIHAGPVVTTAGDRRAEGIPLDKDHECGFYHAWSLHTLLLLSQECDHVRQKTTKIKQTNKKGKQNNKTKRPQEAAVDLHLLFMIDTHCLGGQPYFLLIFKLYFYSHHVQPPSEIARHNCKRDG